MAHGSLPLAGGERYFSLMPQVLRGAHGVFWVIDSRNMDALNGIQWRIDKFREYVSVPEPVSVLVLNKVDTFDASTTFDDFEQFAESQGMERFRTSAKTGEGVSEMFERMAMLVVERLPVIVPFGELREAGRALGDCC
jgi:GTPase SAR1 family protein